MVSRRLARNSRPRRRRSGSESRATRGLGRLRRALAPLRAARCRSHRAPRRARTLMPPGDGSVDACVGRPAEGPAARVPGLSAATSWGGGLGGDDWASATTGCHPFAPRLRGSFAQNTSRALLRPVGCAHRTFPAWRRERERSLRARRPTHCCSEIVCAHSGIVAPAKKPPGIGTKLTLGMNAGGAGRADCPEAPVAR